MKLQKITPGFVVQIYDTEAKQFVSQEFVAGDDVSVEDTDGTPVDPEAVPYLPYYMEQPEDSEATLRALEDSLSYEPKTYLVINEADPNDEFEVEAIDSEDAAYAALEYLGWMVAEPAEDDDDFDEDEDARNNEAGAELNEPLD